MDFIIEEDNESQDEEYENEISLTNNNNSNVKNVYLSLNERENIENINKAKQEENERQKEEAIKKRRRLFLQKKANMIAKPKDDIKNYKSKRDKNKKEDNNQIDELLEIKNYYLGIKKKERKKEFRPKENSKDFFVFEWHESEDTAKNINPLYLPKNTSSIMFGRGNLGGIDPKEIKAQSKAYKKLVEKYTKS
jgi:hypothetical protein